MPYCIGIDEAGYGPNLGPLVIAATVWEVENSSVRDPLGQLARLADRLRTQASSTRPLLVIDDSKAVFRSGHGLAALERTVSAALRMTRSEAAADPPGTWRSLWAELAPEAAVHGTGIPWYRDFDEPIPVDAHPVDVEAASVSLADALRQAATRLVAMRGVAIFPEQFNQEVDQLGSKGEALSRWTVQLLCSILAGLPAAPVQVCCDKHGGRNKYGPLLQRVIPDTLIEVHCEGRTASVYRWGPPERRVETQFQAKGDRHLPTALASMTAKLLRELAMRAFNAFWQQRVAGLKSTAGYPQDARRFRQEIGAAQRAAGVPDEQLWRRR